MRYFNLIKNISNWRLYLAAKFGLTADDPLEFAARGGIDLEAPRRLLQTFKEIFMDECYMAGMGQAVPEKPTILDIGANVGYFSLFALSRFSGARVFAFEPLPANYRLLERQKAMNSDRDFTCVQKAVSGERGALTLAYDANDSLKDLARISRIAMDVHSGPKEGENIDALDTFLGKNGFKTRRRPVGMLWAWREGR